MRRVLLTTTPLPHRNTLIPSTPCNTLDESDTELLSTITCTSTPSPTIPTLQEMAFAALLLRKRAYHHPPQPKISTLRELALTRTLQTQRLRFGNNYQTRGIFTHTYYAVELGLLETGGAFRVAKDREMHVLDLLPKLRRYFEFYVFPREVSNQGEEGVFRQQDIEKLGRENLGREQVNAALLARTLKNQGITIPRD